jgi:predicted 2-oxoglutarate/Fe(II)-dependent dioxygenase YbiX
MPNADIFAQFGLFVRRGFLDAESCRRIRLEMSSAARTRAMVRPAGQAIRVVDETMRKTDVAEVSAATAALIESRLLAMQPALETHFQVQLSGCQGPQFYVYEEGDFFIPHQDRSTDPLAPDDVKSRQVSVSIFLNDTIGGLDHPPYRGGAMVFYGTKGDHGGTTFGIPLESEAGMFIAFRSDWMHEVQPITNGRRYSIVAWYC